MSYTAREYTVVVAVDQIHSSGKAINYAFDLCSKLSVPYRLVVLHALALNKPSSMPYIDNLDKASNVDLKEQSKATVTNIHNFVVRFDNRVNYNVETVEAYGDVGSVIEKHLNENYPIVDVLIAGSRNHQGLTKLILGSVSEYLIQHMDCPVTIVKQTSE